MTIDETGKCIDLPTIHSEQVPMTVSPSLLENPDMLRSTFALVANSIVEASDLAREVKALREAVDNMNHALAVAHEREAKAYAERNEALQARDIAVRAREVADAAYDKVNAQRITAENEAHDLREQRDVARNNNQGLAHDLGEALSKVAELEAEVMKLKASGDAELATANKIIGDLTEKVRDAEDLYKLCQDDLTTVTNKLNDITANRDYWQEEYRRQREVAVQASDQLRAIETILHPTL